MFRAKVTRLQWLQSKDLAHLLALGRLGNQYAPAELLADCVAAVRLPPDAPGELAEDLVRFAAETKTPLELLTKSSLPSLRPAALPNGWPEKLWAAFLASEATTAGERLTKMAITIHADIEPDSALRRAVLHDMKHAILSRHRRADAPSVYWTWTTLGRAPYGSNRAQGIWMADWLQYFMFDVSHAISNHYSDLGLLSEPRQ
jgi:hypothetical protein